MYNQNAILLNLYRFRFATQSQLVELLGHHNHSQVSRILKVLHKHKVVEKLESKNKFESSSYYLTVEGCRYLVDNAQAFGIATVPRHLYRNYEASPALIERSQAVLAVYLLLQKKYGEQLAYISKTELCDNSDFPRPLPDAYFELKDERYILEFVPDGLWKTLLLKRLRVLSHGLDDYYDKVLLAVGSTRKHGDVQGLLQRQGYSEDGSWIAQCIGSEVYKEI